MNSLISINNKFMELSPNELTDLIIKSKYVKGIEIYIDYHNIEERTYLEHLVYEMKRKDLILQVHGDITLDIDNQITFLNKLEEYSSYLGYPIIVTMHTIYNDDYNESINNTIDYINNIFKNINSNKVIISLENLNSVKDLNRLNKEMIRPMILNDEQLFFTYDIGHEIIDYGQIINLDEYMIEDIRNVHIHSNNKGNDHYPIYNNDINWNKIIKSLIFLINNHYQYNIVFEYDLYECNGNTIIDKINDYIESIDNVSKHII